MEVGVGVVKVDYAADKVKSLEIDLKGGKSLKKVLSCFLALLLSACFMGCSGNAEIKEEATYAAKLKETPISYESFKEKYN